MLRSAVKGALLILSTAVAVPYTLALLCHLLHAWPTSRGKLKRSMHPRKVYALNYTILQMLTKMKYAPLYIRWKMHYRNAAPSVVRKDISYGRHDHTLDLYYPTPPTTESTEPSPVVVFVFGGAWATGDKSMYGLLCSEMARKLKAVVCCPNYSLYPQGYVDDMIQDVVDCVIWIHGNIHLYNGNKEKIMLVGHSSGAHLCMMAVLELMHEEVAHMTQVGRHLLGQTGASGESIRFDESYFDRGPAGLRDPLEGSSASSGSFCILTDNGNSSNGAPDEIMASNYEVIQGTKPDAEDIRAQFRQMEIGESGIVISKEKTDDGEKDGEEEVEESDDNDSVVTVRQKEGESNPMLGELEWLSRSIKAVVGLAGVYHIGDHYEHESSRGIEDLSCMARAHYQHEHFERFSPTVIVKSMNHSLSLPSLVLIHGTEDYVVPLVSTTKFGEALTDKFADVVVRILPGCDHYDICLDLMQPSRKYYDSIMGILLDTARRTF